MGDPNDKIQYGDNCSLCYANGLTPSAFVTSIAGVTAESGYPDINGSYILTQWPYFACIYMCEQVIEEAVFVFGLSLESPYSNFGCFNDLYGQSFYGESGSPCGLSFTNEITIPTYHWENGTVTCEPAGVTSAYNYAGGLYPVPKAKLELLTDEPTKKVIRTVNNQDGTNFSIKVTP
jgi:hypothetical protein